VIGRFLSDRARATPDRVAIEYGGREISYAELDAGAGAFARSVRGGGPGRWRPCRDPPATRPSMPALFACAQLG
jgi:acyl-CoA synthetase (AMP-forming)/AMP-acid ligase II